MLLKHLKTKVGGVNVFGDSKTNKSQDAMISQLAKNQAVLIKNNEAFIKNGNTYWNWIKILDAKNKAQDTFDNQVSKALSDINSKLSDYMALAAEVKALKQQVAALQPKGEVT